MIQVGKKNTLMVVREVSIGMYLEDGNEGILLPTRFVPPNTIVGNYIDVFIYHDNESRLIATTEFPILMADEIGFLNVKSITTFGAFLDNGIMKDIFVPLSNQKNKMYVGEYHFIKIEIDAQTGRMTGNEKFEKTLSNETLTVKELQEVKCLVYRTTEIGYELIINDLHKGLIHFNDVFKPIKIGEIHKGFIKKITPNNKLDIQLGIQGYNRVENETEKIIRLLNEENGYLPYHDKSAPEAIYEYFGMSKKTFKMAVGKLYKEKKIILTATGIKLL